GDGAHRRAAAAGGWPRGGALGGAARPQGRERLARGRAARPGADLEGQLVRPGGDRGAHERHTRRRRRVRLSRGAPGTRPAAVARVLVELAHASDGGMFVLFTSHGALRRAADAVRDQLGGRWPLLVQGDGQRDQLLRRFREAGSAILLGTDSFWEGVDVPGRALRVLLLAKLPFKGPSEPLSAARLERLAARGLDGFMHYLVPN